MLFFAKLLKNIFKNCTVFPRNEFQRLPHGGKRNNFVPAYEAKVQDASVSSPWDSE